ncbi:uncharacterized protein LOC125738638 isoform X2 [Brienomyrus brachyistius]|uniref:uncharacterized protein LOC125738638 isoform X2 n=1 Tax=Brienomyrus brachyistius TaxID=42636 RepID=UPI0020B3643A|nr:uncharacterized protein LOC125738638 isoform X2 [Brienomyrus brachyistius]
MSESIVRKVQPFTIGTKLSIPAVAKCPEFTDPFLPSQPLDNRKLPRNLNDRVSLFLGQARAQGGHAESRFSPVAARVAQVERQREEPTEEDDVNRNAVSPTVASRSIRKITISGSGETSGDVAKLPGARASPELEKINNNNNNNNIGVKGIPRIIGVTCENKPHSHFKVLLRKDAKDEQQSPTSQGGIGLQPSGDKANKAPVPRSASPRRCPPKRESPTSRNTAVLSGVKPVAAQTDCSFTKRNALFNKEVLQAEEWIKAKLRDLKDGCSVQRCPLQDWEQVSQTLQRDLKDFENNLIQLNQMGEQLVCWANPTSELVKKQLAQLREQWQALKQMAAGQARALGGARSLQEFNQKVDRLEVWIKEKQEEEQSLVKGLGENIDKMQLTRRILDLKQDEPHYRALHEEINHLALKLEKQSKTESKNISVRRKHINKMWLKVQTLLKDYHESLQLALEVSSFYQQADSILCAISDKGKSICAPDDCGSSGDREIRDIASQIMMLDVTVSQLSNLHPALASRVVQKQSEVRDAWAVLQKAIRKEKPIPPSPGSDFTREDGDPATPTGESQGSVGTETLRIMGKEVKEEQNRLKGCVGARDVGSGEMPVDSQEAEAFPRSCATQVPGSGSGHADDVIRKSQAEGERAVPKETKPGVAAARGQSQLYTQLQKFTVSADKTLTWLKNNVAMATHICCTANLDGFEAAKRCQAALEEEILSNGARIEVVKKEGRSLVRAQHPGSAKIEEFLGQLEALWEELKRRHQRNVVVLQESEKLNLKAMNVLKDLNTLETWLQSVECSIRQSSLAGDPESMSAAERESCLLEREVSSRGLELCVLRQEVDKLRCRRHAHAERLPARMAEVEEKYRSVHSALTQQSAELQDTRMLTEFLERVELEEGQALHGSHGDNPGQPLQPDLEERPSLTGPAGVPLMEDIGDPVEELREAVVMLNDTARERGRSLSQDQGIQELLSRYSSLGVRIQQGLSRSEELSGIVQEAETDMAVKCEPHRCGLHRLREQQDELEVDYEVLREDVEEARRSAAWLQVLCPDRMHALDGEARATLQAWEKLGTAMAENRARLQNFARLQDFFQNYLAMISWTEDTRARIFDNVGHRGSASQEPTVTELDLMIEQKFEEFDVLAAAGQELIDEEHHLTNMIRERTEELQSMLGWILVRWRAQKHQWHLGKPKLEPKEDVIYSEATVCTPAQQSVSPHCGTQQTAKVAAAGDTSGRREGCGWEQSESGYEVMGSISPNEKGSGAGSPAETHQDPMAIETSRSPFLVMKEPSAPALGGTVNLILSFSKMGDSQLQVQEAMEEAEVTEPVHRVSTYLHVKDNKAASSEYENITLPRSATKVKVPMASSSSSGSSSSLLKSSPSSVIDSLKRRSKKRKRKGEERRHTIQRVMGEELAKSVPPSLVQQVIHSTNTWPLKERKKVSKEVASSSGTETQDYVKNPILKDIDAECTGDSLPVQPGVEKSPGSTPAEHGKNHCRYLSLGSILSFDLPKDFSLIPSIPDVITIFPADPKGTDHLRNYTDPLDPNGRYSYTERHTTMTTFKQTRSPPVCRGEASKPSPTGKLTTPVISHGIPPPERVKPSQNQSQTTVSSDLSDLQLSCLSDVSGQHEQLSQEQDKMAVILDFSEPMPSESFMPSVLREKEHLNKDVNCDKSTVVSVNHMCPSVHTKVQDLKEHRYHKNSISGANVASNIRKSPRGSAGGMESSVGLGAHRSENMRICTEAAHQVPSNLLRGVVGKAIFVQTDNCDGDPTGFKMKVLPTAEDNVHPDHQQFEEEEEELQDIWNQTNSYRQSICSDIMYQTHQEETTNSPASQPQEARTQGQAMLYRKLVTASAPNLLVAEFRLPPSVQSLLGYNKDPKRESKSLSKGDRRSWAAFPEKEPMSRQVSLVNETASHSMKLPDTEDQEKYIYHYREEEEEEEEDKDLKEGTGCPKGQSMSLFSVHMGLEEDRCPAIGSDCDRDEHGKTTSPGRRCNSMNGRKPEFQSMEGTLERKHKLQLGGKRAPCRAWSTYHAILFRQTLCFYQDRKDTLKSSVAGLPLNVTGAECVPVPEYSKRANCFSLRLRDGSEYLLSASSRFLMKKWMLKIQANSVLSEADPPRPLHPASVEDRTLETGGVVPTSPSGCSQAGTAKGKEIVVLPRDSTQIPDGHRRNLQDLSSASSPHKGYYYGSLRPRLPQSPPETAPSIPRTSSPSSKRRSHSFTSATYQKITPVTMPPGSRDGGSSYTVTLFIRDQLSEAEPASSGPDLASATSLTQGPLTDSPHGRSYASLPWPRNKSVFKKFFGKRE